MTYSAIIKFVKDFFHRVIDEPAFTRECLRKAYAILEDLNDPKSRTFFYNPSSLRERTAKIYALLDMAGITTSTLDKTGQPWGDSIGQAVAEACIRSVYERLQNLESSNSPYSASHIQSIAVIIHELLEMAGIHATARDNTEQPWGKRIELAVVKAYLGSVDAKLENLQNTPPNHARDIQYEAGLIHELLEVAGIDATARDAKTGLSWTQRIEQAVVGACLRSASVGLGALEDTTAQNITFVDIKGAVREIRDLFQAAAELRPVDPKIVNDAEVRIAAVFDQHGIRGPG